MVQAIILIIGMIWCLMYQMPTLLKMVIWVVKFLGKDSKCIQLLNVTNNHQVLKHQPLEPSIL